MNVDTAARRLRAELDQLLDRFRDDTIIEGANASDIVQEVRLALEEEFFVLLSRYSTEVLQKAVLLTHDESMRLPIHLACDKNAPFPILQRLLEADSEKTSIEVPDKWGDLPLHTACSRHQTEVVRLLLAYDATKKTLQTKADNGSLPIHAAVRYRSPPSIIIQLLESSQGRNTLLEPGFYGQLPLHAACRNGAHPDVIDLLLRYDEDKKAIMQEDTAGRLPVHLALLHTTENQLQVIQLLLQGMFCSLMERRGLDFWKTDMISLMKIMTDVFERDFITRDKLDIICDTISEFMERVLLLELAVWRASCLQFDTKFASMRELLDFESAKSNFDEHDYKIERRVKSGADIIVRGVIPFLENELVTEIVAKLKEIY